MTGDFKYFDSAGIGRPRVSQVIKHWEGDRSFLDNYNKKNVFHHMVREFLPSIFAPKIESAISGIIGGDISSEKQITKAIKDIVKVRISRGGDHEKQVLEGSDNFFAADNGTAVHNIGEMRMCKYSGTLYKGTDPHVDYIREEAPREYIYAMNSLDMWWEDFKKKNMAIVEVEKSMCSDLHGFGGEPDHIVEWEHGGLKIGDFKVSREMRTSHMVQLGAYSILGKEFDLDIRATEIIHIHKTKKPGYETRLIYGRELAACENAFMTCLSIFKQKDMIVI